MSNYEKPVVIINDDVAEGVFLASGSGDGGSGLDVTFELNPTGSGSTIVHVIFTNNGAEAFTLNKFKLTFDKDVDFITPPFSPNVSASCNGTPVLTADYKGPAIEGNGGRYTFIAHLNQVITTPPRYQINP